MKYRDCSRKRSPSPRQPSAPWPLASSASARRSFRTSAESNSAERLRTQLAEQPTVIRGELPGVPEAPTLGDLLHGRRARGGGLQLLTDRIEPTRLEIGHRTQAADLLERIVQRPLADV